MGEEHIRCTHCGFSIPEMDVRCPNCEESVVGIDEHWLSGGR